MAKMADFMLSNAKFTTGSALTSAATGLVSGLGYMVSASSSTVSKSGNNETGVNATATVLQVGGRDDDGGDDNGCYCDGGDDDGGDGGDGDDDNGCYGDGSAVDGDDDGCDDSDGDDVNVRGKESNDDSYSWDHF